MKRLESSTFQLCQLKYRLKLKVSDAQRISTRMQSRVHSIFVRLADERVTFARSLSELLRSADGAEHVAREPSALAELTSIAMSGPAAAQVLALSGLATLADVSKMTASSLCSAGSIAALCRSVMSPTVHPLVLAGACNIIRSVACHDAVLANATLDDGSARVIALALADVDVEAREAGAAACAAIATYGSDSAARVLAGATADVVLQHLCDALQLKTFSLARVAASAIATHARVDVTCAATLVRIGAVPRLLGLLACAHTTVRAEALSALSEIIKHGGAAGYALAESIVLTRAVVVGYYPQTSAPSTVSKWSRSRPRFSAASEPRKARSLQSRVGVPHGVANIAGVAMLPLLCAAIADDDASVRLAAARSLHNLVRHGPAIVAFAVCAGAIVALGEYAMRHANALDRLPALVALGYCAAADPSHALEIIRIGVLDLLQQILLASTAVSSTDTSHEHEPLYCRAAVLWVAGQIGRHSAEHALHIAKCGMLRLALNECNAHAVDVCIASPTTMGTNSMPTQQPVPAPQISNRYVGENLDTLENDAQQCDLRDKALRMLEGTWLLRCRPSVHDVLSRLHRLIRLRACPLAVLQLSCHMCGMFRRCSHCFFQPPRALCCCSCCGNWHQHYAHPLW